MLIPANKSQLGTSPIPLAHVAMKIANIKWHG